MGLPPSSENLRVSRASTESFQRRRIYQIETEKEPMVDVQFLENESPASNNSEHESQKGISAVSLSEKDDQEHPEVLGSVNDLGEVNDLDEVNDVTDEHTQRGD